MSELAAQQSKIEKIVDAIQSIQERLVCGICLELFTEPVTLRCGHRFCKSCILRVTNNENSACPLCNKKIRKRSIPIESNKTVQSLVKHFLILAKAITEDSGIDVLASSNKPKSTKESVSFNNRPSTSKVEETSNVSRPSISKFEESSNVSKESSTLTNQKSSKSRIKSQSSRRNSLTKKQANSETKKSNNVKNTLHKYLSNKSDNVPDQEIHSEEKVKSWLSNINSHIDDAGTSDSPNEGDSPFLKKVNENFKVPEILESTQLIENNDSPRSNNYPSTSKANEPELDISDSVSTKEEELKYKETQSRIQELEMMAKRKKSNLNLSDKTVSKTPTSVPAATHSDAYDWRRVKKIGKEMLAKTFKSLNVSVEKNCSSAIVDENVPSTSSASNDNNSRQKMLKVHDNSHHKETTKTNNSSMDTTGSHRGENISFSCINEQQVNDIIGILPAQDDLCTPERIRNISSNLNKECTSRLEQSNPLIKSGTKNYENDAHDNIQISPSKHRLSLKKNLIHSSNSKLKGSQSSTSDKTNQSENNSPRKFSPERPKSRLSLRLPLQKTSDQPVKQTKPDVSNQDDVQNTKPDVSSHGDVQNTVTHQNFQKRNLDNDRNSASSCGPHISFKKLGKICKKRKNVPFTQVGKLRPKIITSADKQEVSSVLVKSNVPVNFEIKSLIVNSKTSSDSISKHISDNKEMKILLPEEDSQLKYLSIESPHRQRGVSKIIHITENVNKSTCALSNQDQLPVPVEVDQKPPDHIESDILMKVDKASAVHHILDELEMLVDSEKENNSLRTNKKVHVDIEDTSDISKNPNKEDVEDKLQSYFIKAGTSQYNSKIKTPDKTTIYKPIDNQNSSPVKAKVNEDGDEEQEIDSISSKETDKHTKSPSAQNIAENNKIDLTGDSESESNEDSEIQNKSIKTSALSASTVSSMKESNKYSEAESTAESDVSEAKIQHKSTLSSARERKEKEKRKREREEVSEAESNADSDIPKIRRRLNKTSSSSSSTLTSTKNINETSKAENKADIRNSEIRCNSKKAGSSSASTLSSIKKNTKKKRTHSDSSNDEEELYIKSIIGKWCDNADVPASKKAKVVSIADNDLITNQNNINSILIDDDDDIVDVTLVGEQNQMETKVIQRDPPIDDIISKVKSFKEMEPSTNKLVGIPNSLMSADLFESNEQCIQSSAQISPKQVNSEPVGDKSQNVSDTTLVDLKQTSKNKSNLSECSDGSNKENNKSNKINLSPAKVEKNSEDQIQINEIENSYNEKSKITKNLNSSQTDDYQIPDSLMNITQEQLALKRIEKDLIGIDLSTIRDNKNKKVEQNDNFSTPHGTKKQVRNIDEVNEGEEFDPDNIDATPCAKRSRKSIRDSLPNQLLSKFNTGSQINSSEIFSPGNNQEMDLIPAITPVKNRKSYPLCHSTPMMNAQNSESQSAQPKMVIVCSGLQADQIKTVQNFARRFNGKFQAAFSMDVTHVITSTEPNTKIGQRTFKYIQGIAFKKHVLSFQWILDCLDKNTLLDEEDEKYEVLDGDVLESGAKKSRNRQQGLFLNFAFFCPEPFTALSTTEFKNILVFNDAVVADNLAQLAAQKNKYRVIILPEDFALSQRKLSTFKKAQCAIVSFDWIVDSISQYHTISIAPYLQETTTEELLELGFPAEYLEEEDGGEEEEEEEEEDEL